MLILVVALVVFGPNKLPEMGKALGTGLREFKKATQAITDDVKQAVAEDAREANKPEPKAQPPKTEPSAESTGKDQA